MQARSRLIALMLVTVPAWSACATTEGDSSAHASAKTAADDPAAMMAEMEKLGTPGEAHKKLEPMIGRFKANVKMWMDPSAPPEESTGTTENRWILGNRFIMSEHKGQMMGKPFEGIGLTGYDNMKQRYVSTWCDSMGTMIMPVSFGTMEGKVITTKLMMDDPMTGKPTAVREVTNLKSSNEFTFEMWMNGPDGKEFKTLEIVYTRM